MDMDTGNFVQNVSDMEVAVSAALFSAMDSVKEYYTPLLVPLALISNSVVLYRLFSTALRRLHFTAYIVAMSLVDCIFLVLLMLLWMQYHNVWLNHMPGWCQGLTMTGFICNALAVWFVVGLAVEALLTLQWPYQTGVWWPAWRPRCWAIIMSTVAVIVYLNICLLYAIIPLNDGRVQCLPLPNKVSTVQLLDRLDTAFNFVAAYTVLILTCFGILIKLRTINADTTVTVTAVHFGKLAVLFSLVLVLTGLPNNVLRLWPSLLKSPDGRSFYLGLHQLLLQVSFARTLFILPLCFFGWPAFRNESSYRPRAVTVSSGQSSVSLNHVEITEMDTELELMDRDQEAKTSWSE